MNDLDQKTKYKKYLQSFLYFIIGCIIPWAPFLLSIGVIILIDNLSTDTAGLFFLIFMMFFEFLFFIGAPILSVGIVIFSSRKFWKSKRYVFYPYVIGFFVSFILYIWFVIDTINSGPPDIFI